MICNILLIVLARDHRLKIAQVRPEYDTWPTLAFRVAFWIHKSDEPQNILLQTSTQDICPIVSVSMSAPKSILKSQGVVHLFSFLPL